MEGLFLVNIDQILYTPPTRNPAQPTTYHAQPSLEARKLKFGGCFLGVYRGPEGYLKCVWKVFLGVSEGCLEFVSLTFMEARKRKFSWYLLAVYRVSCCIQRVSK